MIGYVDSLMGFGFRKIEIILFGLYWLVKKMCVILSENKITISSFLQWSVF